MKSVLILCLSFAMNIPLAISQMNIVDYFNKLPLPNKSDLGSIGKFPKKKDAYYYLSPLGDTLNLTVDLKNGFLETLDNGTGGGISTIQLAKFKTADGKQFVVYRKDGREGDNGMQWELDYSVYWIQNEKLVLAQGILPPLSVQDFLATPEKSLSSEENKKILMKLHCYLELPRNGTTIIWRIQPTEGDPYLKKIKYKKIQLVFDKKTGKFSFGAKS
ncbi:MAG: hypothetical protein RLZZ628_4402 [Bacteroidota bacterium]|jgi:hypothetical protein